MQEKKYVWDILVRVFHWSLVVAFMVSYLSGEEWQSLHVVSGYIILSLILIRIVWGFIGSRHARFSDFVRCPLAAVAYLKSVFTGKPKHYDGHNPAGGLMVVALLLSLLCTGLSGLKTLGYEGEGPFAVSHSVSADNDDAESRFQALLNEHSLKEKREAGEEYWEEIHEFFVNLSLLLVVIHLGGVFLSSRAGKENLVKAMFTGYKPAKSQEPED